MMSDLIQLEKRGHIAVLTINNPPANTWTADSVFGRPLQDSGDEFP
jgi:enoyl-CoA hydratase/carnithine racemase